MCIYFYIRVCARTHVLARVCIEKIVLTAGNVFLFLILLKYRRVLQYPTVYRVRKLLSKTTIPEKSMQYENRSVRIPKINVLP